MKTRSSMPVTKSRKEDYPATVLTCGHYKIWKHDTGLVEVIEAIQGGFIFIRTPKDLANLRKALASLARLFKPKAKPRKTRRKLKS